MFVDTAKIYLKAGDGGKGCISFRREKYVPRGGPDGGDGGHGGDIYFEASSSYHTLIDQKYQQHHRAHRGAHGRGKNQGGKSASDLIIKIPLGTMIKDAATGELLADLTQKGQRFLAAKGGKGGRGNARFATPTKKAPRIAEDGGKGEEKTLLLELKLLADVGLVGLPNAGKSTLLAAISAARPKIADYPFTTLVPLLGLAKVDKYSSFVVADIPGLIEGAHQGKGLGIQFLRHIERTKVLVHVIDAADPQQTPQEAYRLINQELSQYKRSLSQLPQVVALNKMDLLAEQRVLSDFKKFLKGRGIPAFPISAAKKEGLAPLLRAVAKALGMGKE
jgi:GTP-binding protein